MVEKIWNEKYRPQKVSECVLPVHLKAVFENHISNGQIPSMIFAGRAGCGKTTVAIALAKELGLEWYLLNGSSENGINVLRTKITDFAITSSWDGKPKLMIIDEADGLTPACMDGLKGFIEEYANNCSFIFTCNDVSYMPEPLTSRCPVIKFTYDDNNIQEIKTGFYNRLVSILDAEQCSYNPEIIAALINAKYPDFRSIIHIIQMYGSKNIDSGILLAVNTDFRTELKRIMTNKNFEEIREYMYKKCDEFDVIKTLASNLDLYFADVASKVEAFNVISTLGERIEKSMLYKDIHLTVLLLAICGNPKIKMKV